MISTDVEIARQLFRILHKRQWTNSFCSTFVKVIAFVCSEKEVW